MNKENTDQNFRVCFQLV